MTESHSSRRQSRRAARRERNLRVAFVALAVFGVAGVGTGVYWWSERNVSSDHFVKSAQQYAEQKNYSAALIQIRNAVQKSPQDARIRFLFAQILEKSRDLGGAEKEARKALDLGYGGSDAVPLIARVLLKTGRAEELLKEYGSLNLSRAGIPIEFVLSIAEANLSVERFGEAKRIFDIALREQPDHAAALVGNAKVLLTKSDVEGAKAILANLLKRTPPPREALSLQADLSRATGDLQTAITTYEQIAEQDEDGSVRFRLGRAYVEAKQYDKAQATAAALIKSIPGDPRGGYLQGLVALEKGDLEQARRSAVDVLRKVPTHGPSQLLAGITSVETGQYEQGKTYLQGLLGTPAFRVHAYKALIKANLRTDDPSRARVLAEEALAIEPNDAVLQTLAAEAAMRAGDLATAAKHFESGSKAKPENTARLGQTLIASGQTDKGIAVLESAMQAPESKLQSILTLAVVHLQKREFRKALPLLDEVEKIEPKSAVAPALRGTALLAQNDLKGARAQLETALERDAQNIVALDTLARIDAQEGKAERARARFESILGKSPGNEGVALAYVFYLRQQKASPEAVTAVLDAVVRANPSALRSRLALIDLHMDYGRGAKAVSAGRDALAVNPNDVTVMQALGRAHLFANEAQQAVTQFAKVTELQPKNLRAWLQLADAAHLAKGYPQSLDAAKRALELAPSEIESYQRVARAHLAMGDAVQALRIAERAQKALPKQSASYVLEADLYASEKRWDESIKALEKGLAVAPSTAIATKLHDALSSSGKNVEAESSIRAWLKSHPSDVAARGYLGERLALSGEFAKARKEFEHIVDSNPKNVLALNNLAWVSFKLNDAKAIKYAEQANALRPNDPVLLDTLGSILVGQGQAAKGIETLQRAVSLAPNQDRLRLNLAKAHITVGDQAAARRELSVVAGRAAESQEKREATELMGSL